MKATLTGVFDFVMMLCWVYLDVRLEAIVTIGLAQKCGIRGIHCFVTIPLFGSTCLETVV